MCTPQNLLITVVDSKIPVIAYSQNIDERNRRYSFYFSISISGDDEIRKIWRLMKIGTSSDPLEELREKLFL